jgi:predicted acetyltransferase
MKESFGDPDWYIDFSFEYLFNDNNTPVYLENGEPVSMLMLLDCEVYTNDAIDRLSYVYGVSTLKAFRGKGYSTKLMEFINRDTLPGVKGTLLTPAEDSLFDFYGNRGYETTFSIKEAEISVDDFSSAENVRFEKIDGSLYKRLRDNHFKATGYVSWPENIMVYMVLESEKTGGGAFKVIFDGSGNNGDFIMYRREEEHLFIKECNLDGDKLFSAVNALLKAEGLTKAFLRLKADSKYPGTVRPFAMGYKGVKNHNREGSGYFNLPLD